MGRRGRTYLQNHARDYKNRIVSIAPLDIENQAMLLAYLRRKRHIGVDETPEFRNLAGGVSNRAVWIQRSSGEAWVIKQALTKLRVKADWFSDPRRIHREAMGIRWLQRLAPPGTIPALISEDFDEHLLMMQAVPHPHADWKSLLMTGQINPDHVEQFARLLGDIHRVAADHQPEIEKVFGDTSFFESLRIEPYYLYTSTQVPAAKEFIDDLISRTRRRRFTLVHGDYSPKNILVHEGRLVLLDHEVIHFGDPAFDLGFSLTHLLSKAHYLSALRVEFAEAAKQYWLSYRRAIGEPVWLADLQSSAVHHTLGCLLSRVAGRSPLEYLDASRRAAQQAAVLSLIGNPPLEINALVDELTARFNA